MVTSPEIRVLDKGFVAVEQIHASDLDVVNAARVSFNEQQDKMTERGEGLVRYLLKNKHGTPFEHTYFKFRIKAPLFVFREWHRHRIGWSYNEWSGRYSKLQCDFYAPERKQIRHQVGKPGAYTFQTVEDDELANEVWHELAHNAMHAYQRYEMLLDKGIAKELARMVLPVNLYSQMIATCNARSLMAFLSLRNTEHAMHEIREYAIVLEKALEVAMPVTHAAFVENGRVAP